MEPSRIQAVNHVDLEAPPGLAEELRWFYAELAQLDEVICDEAEAQRLCFKSEQIELRVHLVENPRIDPVARRVTIAVLSLTEAAELLDERSLPYARVSGLLFTDRRLEMHDPAGNRVVLKQHWGDGPL